MNHLRVLIDYQHLRLGQPIINVIERAIDQGRYTLAIEGIGLSNPVEKKVRTHYGKVYQPDTLPHSLDEGSSAGVRASPAFSTQLPSRFIQLCCGSAFFTYLSNQRSSSYASCSFDSMAAYQCGS